VTDTSIFDYLKTPLKIDKPIRLIELFAGVGSQAKALARLGADFEHYRISEWEVNAAASYKAIHKTDDSTDYSAEFTADELTEVLYNIGISTDGKKPLTLKEIARKGEEWKRTVYNNFKATNNVGSILNISGADLGIVDTDTYCYVMTYSFPCQDLSLAGKQKGMEKGSGTRSGLLWEVERLLNECDELPQILLMENVTQVHGTKNREHFEEWIAFLESKGYSNYWQDLNAKNFGIPQNRNRTFMVSVLGEYTYEFPEEFPLKLRLKDMLEDAVDEKFYISDGKIEKIVNSSFGQEKTMIQKSDVCGTLLARDYKDPKCVGVNGDVCKTVRAGGKGSLDRHSWYLVADTKCEQAGVLTGGKWDKMHDVSRRVYSDDGIAPTLHTCGGGNTEPKVLAGVIEPFIGASRGRNPENPSDRTPGIPLEQTLELNFSGCANTLTTVQKDNYVVEPVIIEDFYKNRDERVYEGVAPTIRSERNGLKVAEPLAYDEQNGYIRKDGTVGTLTTDGSSPKHNNRVVENCYVSEKGVRFICSPKRGMTTDVNAEISQPLTAKGQANWTGSFVSPDIENLEKSSTIGSTEPTKINLKSGETVTSNDNLSGLRIRKLTPKECWRLMGFDDADFEKAAAVNSNSQLYKQAGNSIVVDVLCYIFGMML
jgi:DNA (cytosine-5)-methyltransferase 1